MKVLFLCVLCDWHEQEFSFSELILSYPPRCCGMDMVAGDPVFWHKVQRVLNDVNISLLRIYTSLDELIRGSKVDDSGEGGENGDAAASSIGGGAGEDAAAL